MPNPVPLGATCHCGAISIKIPHPPAFIHDCNCSFCLNTGAVWGYYAASEVSITGKVARYARADLAETCSVCQFLPNLRRFHSLESDRSRQSARRGRSRRREHAPYLTSVISLGWSSDFPMAGVGPVLVTRPPTAAPLLFFVGMALSSSKKEKSQPNVSFTASMITFFVMPKCS